MVDSVESNISVSPQNAREAAEKAASEEALAKATALLNDRINQISADPNLSADDKRKLIGQLNSVKGSSNLQAIYSVMQEVSSQLPSAEAEAIYERASNASVAQSLYTGSFNISTAQGRHAFAAALMGPHATKEEVDAAAYVVTNSPEIRAAAEKFAHQTPQQRAAHEAQRADNVKEVRALAHTLEQDKTLSAEARNYLHNLAAGDDSHNNVRGHGRTLDGLRKFAHTHNLDDVRPITDEIEAKYHAVRAMARARLRAEGVSAAKADQGAEAIASNTFKLWAAEDSERSEAVIRSTKLGVEENIKQSTARFYETNSQDDSVRIAAYMQAYNAVETKAGHTVDQVALKHMAEEYVHTHAAQKHALTLEAAKQIYSDSKPADQARIRQNLHTALEGSGYSASEVSSFFTSMGDGLQQMASGNELGSAKAAKRAAGDVENIVAATTGGHGTISQTVANFASTAMENYGIAQARINHKLEAAQHLWEKGNYAGMAAAAGRNLLGSITSTVTAVATGDFGFKAQPNAQQQHQAEVAAVRRAIDTNHDGKLSGQEATAYLAARGLTVNQADKDHKGLGMDDLVAASHQRVLTPAQQAKANVDHQYIDAKTKLGLDPKHAYSMAEIKKALHDHGVKDADLNKMLQDGKISVGEVITAVQHLPNQKPAQPHGKHANAH